MESRVLEVEREIGISSAQAHAALARVAVLAAEFEELGGWAEGGIRSFPHWLSVWAGFGPRTGADLLRVGQALRALPHLAAAFAAGQVSYDKVRLVTLVATPDADEFMTELARGATGGQLERICRSIRRMLAEEEECHRARRGLWIRLCDDGLVHLTATLTAEEGEIVKQAIESVAGSTPVAQTPDDGADDRWAARRADAVVAICDGVLSGGAGTLVAPGEARQLVVHVDVGVLTGETPEGLCHLESHHHEQWFLGGGTNLADMLLLCGFHHRTFHEGGYRIIRDGKDFRFETNDGAVIGAQPPVEPGEPPPVDEEAARSEWGGARVDFDHLMFVVGQAFVPN